MHILFSKPLFLNPNAINLNEELGIERFINKKEKIALFRFLKKNHVSLLTESPGPPFPHKQLNRRTLYGNRLWNILYSLFGFRTVYIGKCCSDLIPENIKIANTYVSAYYLRSKESVDYFSSQISPKKVNYIPDLSFLLHYYVTSSYSKKKIAALDIRLIEGKEHSIKNWCKRIIQDLVSQSFEVVVYYQVGRDYSIAKDLYSELYNLGVHFRKDILWYEDLSFYTDKMFVISNRLHSLLLGAIYDAYPICICSDSLYTLKLEHVIRSSFGSELPILFYNNECPQISYEFFYHSHLKKMKEKLSDNAKMCREIIEKIVEGN